MKIVYAGHKTLEGQDWGGNIQDNSISMSPVHWHKLFESYEG
jgi:hypothetical protein